MSVGMRPRKSLPKDPVGIYGCLISFGSTTRKLVFFDIERGSSVDIYPFEGVDDPILEMWLLGCVMAVLLHQRGFVILHACALQVNGQNVALIGESGMGKSTMTAAMLAQGYDFIVDDLVAIDVSGPQPMILPGFPMLKLTEEIATRFGFDLDSSLGRHPYKGKLFFHAQPVSDDPLPLHHLLFLDRMDEPGMEFRRLSSREAFFEAGKEYPADTLGLSQRPPSL